MVVAPQTNGFSSAVRGPQLANCADRGPRTAALETVTQCQTDLTFRVRGVETQDTHEVAAGDAARRVAEIGRIREVRCLHARLDSVGAGQGERPEDREVEVPAAGAAELIRARRAEPHSLRLYPGGGIHVV